MYGGAGKHGRGGSGGRGGVGVHGKRNIHSTFTAHPLHRPSPVSGGRLSLGGGSAGPRQRVSTASAPPSSAPSAVEETFNLVTGNPLNFAMTIQRLPPDLVEEIKRVEAQGGVARIKFDANANANASNTFGNVIVDVGGKNFRFTWSRDTGDLCDTYEQRQSGEDGNGLLVESGCAWRKLNLQRVLDESTTNHVKMLSEEADPKNRTRKSKLLDHGNPSMKSQMKAMAAVEANPRRQHFKQKKESPFKKRKVEPPPGGPPKSVHISGLSGTTPSKGRLSASPMPSPSEQLGALASPSGTGEPSKMQVYVEDAMPPQVMMGRENAVSGPEKEMSSRLISGAATDKHGRKGDLGTKPADLRSMLVSLLMENPKGMSLKALEKAIRDTIPNSARQIEQVLKKIANFQAPGRYILKPGVEFESSKKLSSESGSSPEDNRHETPALENNFHQLSSSENTFSVRDNVMELQEPAQLNSKPGEDSNVSDKVNLSHHSPNLPLGEKKVSDNSEGPVGSSSNSGSDSDSDSDSDSSDSGSDSGSHSKKSPVGSGSGSSSDSESDASSNSKEGSDEDVDIMTSDDEKESKHKSQPSELGFSTSDGGPVHSGIDEKHDGHSSDIVEIEKDSPDNGLEAEMAVVTNSGFNKEVNKPVEESNTSSIGHHEHQESRVYSGNLSSERENVVKDGFKLEQSNSSERTSQGKYKRGNEGNNFNDKPENSKRFKAGNMSQPQVTSRIPKDGTGFGVQKGYDQSLSGQSIYESPQLGRRPIDVNVRAKTPAMGERSDRNADSLGHDGISSERSLHAYGGFSVRKDKVNTVTHDEDGYSGRKKASSNSREGGLGDRNTAPVDFQYRNHKELTGKFKEAGPVSNSRNGFFPVDNNGANMNRSPAVNGQRSILQRELSDLELGELREPMNEETPSVKKQLEKKTSFKQLETNPTTLDHWNSNSSKGKPPGRAAADLRMFSPNVGISSNPESLSKKKSPEHLAEDFARPHHRVMQPQPQHQSRVANNEFGSQTNKLPDLTSKNRHIESRLSQGIGLEINGDPQRRVPVGAQQQHDTEQVAPRSTEESKQHNAVDVFSDKRNGTSLMETDDGGQTRKESSWDEENLYSKYEKEEPELKGPIKDFSQYKEYVQEYCEKYDAYCSLNKILEFYRNDFKMLGKDLDMAKGVDLKGYNIILERLKDTYRQCGKRHKRLKKIFVVLHEELKHLKQMIKDFAVSYTKD